MEERVRESAPNPEEERLDLTRMDEESKELTMLAEFLVKMAREGFTATRLKVTPKKSAGLVAGEGAETSKLPAIQVEEAKRDLRSGASTRQPRRHANTEPNGRTHHYSLFFRMEVIGR